MTEFTREIMYGKRPVRRTHAEPGQSEWYYLDPRGSDSFEEMKQIDVPSEDTPNPFADEIQNYLYNNDEYNYKQLYGDTPPPAQINQSRLTPLNKTNSYTTESAWNYPNNTSSPYYQQFGKPYNMERNCLETSTNSFRSIDYSRYGDGFTKEFIDEMERDEEFKKILNEYIIPNEGGYKNDADDSGGETNMGIAQNAHPNENIKNMTRERANAIYYRDYYKWNGLNKLPYPIRGFVVDYGLPTCPQYAIETVHKVLNLPPKSNIIGATTLDLFEKYTDEDYNDFLEKYRKEMKQHFKNVVQKEPRKQKFLKGWLNRADRAHLAK